MKKNLSYLLATLVFNTAIAGVLSMLLGEIPFSRNLIFAHCIGLAILASNLLVIRKIQRSIPRIAVMALTLPASVLVGVVLAIFLSGFDPDAEHTVQAIVTGLFFGLIGIIVVLLSERIAMEVRQRELIRSEGERREIEARLKLLQAQIEPHFLFNTLANVGSLIDGNPALAKTLLEHLNDWLRVALARTRSTASTLGDELAMLENYLEIMKIRFGERLRWRIDIGEETLRQPFPPMLLQPLLENAVRHGIEPKLGGGEICIRGRIENQRLRLEVSDNGMGLADKAILAGAGLSNVDARLRSLFGEAGELTLTGNAEGGVTATLSLPEQREPS